METALIVEFYLGAKSSINLYISPTYDLDQKKKLVSSESGCSLGLMVRFLVLFKGKHSLLLMEVFLRIVLSQRKDQIKESASFCWPGA